MLYTDILPHSRRLYMKSRYDNHRQKKGKEFPLVKKDIKRLEEFFPFPNPRAY